MYHESYDNLSDDEILSEMKESGMMKRPEPAIVLEKKGATSERAYWTDLTAKLLDRPFAQILGLTRDWPVGWISDMYLLCSKAKEGQRLWWGLRKKNGKGKLST